MVVYKGDVCELVVYVGDEVDLCTIFSYLGNCSSSKEPQAQLIYIEKNGKRVKAPAWYIGYCEENCPQKVTKYKFSINLAKVRLKESYFEEYEGFKNVLGI